MKHCLTKILVVLILAVPMAAQQESPQKEAELAALETKLQSLQAQYATLEQFSPRDFPDFKELEITHQLVERLDFNRRKFDLLVSTYNLVEDEIFPLLLSLSTEQPARRARWLRKIGTYGGQGENGLLEIQRQINSVALLIERLEKQIERLRESERQKELLAATTLGQRPAAEVPISIRLRHLESELEKFAANLKSEQLYLETLQAKQKEQKEKVAEKQREIQTLKAQAQTARNPVERRIKGILAQVRGVRLNGLEIPKLNTTQTFIYVTENRIHTLEDRIASSREELEYLKVQSGRQLRNQILRGFLVVVIAILVILVLIRIARKVVRNLMKRVEESGHLDDHHKQRYQTLSSVMLSIIKVLLWILGVLWVLGELNIDYAPFLVAAGGLSLAIGFGAQSLVKDFFSGFFMLMEEQLALGDVVEINGKTGTVEKISFRTIKMRALDGTVHIIPNGNVGSVSNLTHKWSTAVVKIGVAYDTKAEQVMQVLREICADMIQDPEWGNQLVGEPLPQGIVSFGDSSVNYRILAKTLPGQQWAVGRELNIRIKRAFDTKGIEIPYNYVNVVNRTPGESTAG